MKIIFMIRPLCLWASSFVFAFNGYAEERAAGGEFYYSADSENFSSRRISADFMTSFSHLNEKTGVIYTDYDFSKDSWSRRGQQVRIVSDHIDAKTADGWRVSTGIFRQSSNDLLTLDSSYRKTLSSGHAIEVFANRDFVETQTGLENGTHFNFVGASGDFILNPHFTLVGLAGFQSFSDENQRRHGRMRLIYQPSLDQGLTFQLRYRYYDDSKNNVGGAYFNPTSYQETMLAVGWRQRVNNWRTALTAGVGTQKIAQDASSITQLLEASAERQQAHYSLRLRAGYSNATGAAATTTDYWYSYVSSELLIPF